MQNEPWSIELLRQMTRQEFNARVKDGDLPPPNLAAQLVAERLGRRIKTRSTGSTAAFAGDSIRNQTHDEF